MTRPSAMVFGAGLVLLAVAETLVGGWAYRSRIDENDWEAVRAWQAGRTDDAPVLLASSWLGPRARMELAPLRDWRAVAPPDLRGLADFWVLGLGAEWSTHLEQDLEGLPAPIVTEQLDVGSLTLTRYSQSHADEILWNVTEEEILARLEVSVDGQRCRGRRGRWRCGSHRIELRTEEIEFRARRCLALDVGDGSRVELRLADASLGTVLRGHVGFSDFNGRLRSDVPLGLTVSLGDGSRVDFVVTDDQGWASVAVATPTGLHDLRVEVQVAATGTWHQGRYRRERRRLPCLEFRAMREDSP